MLPLYNHIFATKLRYRYLHGGPRKKRKEKKKRRSLALSLSLCVYTGQLSFPFGQRPFFTLVRAGGFFLAAR